MLKILQTYYRFLFKYKFRMVLFWIMLLGMVVAENVEPYFYKLFVEAIPKNQWDLLIKLSVGFIGIRIASLIFETLMRMFGDMVLLPAARDARMTIFNKIHSLDFVYHTNKSTGSLISLIKRGDGAFYDFFHSINIATTRIAIGFVIMLGFMFNIRWEIGVLTILSFGMALIATYFLVKFNLKTRVEFNAAEDEISNIITDNLINFETVKLFAKEHWEEKRLRKSFVTWINRFWEYAMSYRYIDLVVGGLGNLGFAAMLILGIGWMKDGSMTIGDYIMMMGFITAFYGRFFELVYNLRNIAKHTVDISKYFEVINESEEVKDPEKPKDVDQMNGEIIFDDVSFNYPLNKKIAVRNINLTVRPGQSIALIGHSGVGKTTLVKLLMRFFDPVAGRILIDGVDIKDFTKNRLRSYMGVVPQEPIMFNNSIKYNISYGSDIVTEEEIVAAAKMANMHEFVMGLPKKYETNVGERGVKLSGGQKQRLAIARMILKNPDIIIFDEATSQLDSESEKLIQDAFWKASENKTTIIIAHRLSTIIRAEKIIVMENGEIKEIGSHRQLLGDENSLYTKFWNLQSVDKTSNNHS